jgi:hypothetical protein
MGDRRSWVGGVVVHDRGVVIVHERGGSSFVSGWSSSVGARRCPCAGGRRGVAGADRGGSWWFAIVVRGWLPSVHGVGLVVRPWRGSSSSMSGGRGRRCPCVLVLRGRLSFLGGVRRRTWAVNIRERGGPSTSRDCGPARLSVRARPPWAVVVPRWGSSSYVGGQHSRMGGGGQRLVSYGSG